MVSANGIELTGFCICDFSETKALIADGEDADASCRIVMLFCCVFFSLFLLKTLLITFTFESSIAADKRFFLIYEHLAAKADVLWNVNANPYLLS